MLALTDEALARLVLGATAIAPGRRARGLQDLADRLERSELEPTGARHMCAWRARARSGRCLLILEMDEAELVVGLVERKSA